jgi:hypothetical protein
MLVLADQKVIGCINSIPISVHHCPWPPAGLRSMCTLHPAPYELLGCIHQIQVLYSIFLVWLCTKAAKPMELLQVHSMQNYFLSSGLLQHAGDCAKRPRQLQGLIHIQTDPVLLPRTFYAIILRRYWTASSGVLLQSSVPPAALSVPGVRTFPPSAHQCG